MPTFSSALSGGGGGFLGGGPVRGYDPTFGGIPSIPSPGGSAAAALGSNIGNLGAIYGLGAGLNRFQTGQAIGQLAQGLPDYESMIGQSSKNIGAQLRGEVPGDVITQILQQAAERGIATGTTGAPISNAAYLRALGLTSLGLQQQGEQELTGAIARTPRPALFDPTRFLVTPEQQQEAATAAAQLAAAPIPAFAGTATLGAARGGVRAGMGSIQTPTIRPPMTSPQNLYYDPFAPAGGPAEVAGGALGTPEPSAADIAANWQDWTRALPYTPAPIPQSEQVPTSGAELGPGAGAGYGYVPQSWDDVMQDIYATPD